MAALYCIEDQVHYTVHYLDDKERVDVVYDEDYRAIQDYPSRDAARTDAQRRFPGGREVATFALWASNLPPIMSRSHVASE